MTATVRVTRKRLAKWHSCGVNHPGAAVAVVVLAGGLPLARPASADVPGTFDLSTVAVGVNVASTQSPAASVITAGLVNTTEAYATSALTSYGTAESAAARFYPGDLVAGGPTLLCENFGPCPVDPPTYPLVADAAYPTSPTDAAPGATAHASARDTGAAASAASGKTGPVSVDSVLAGTRAWVDAAGAHVRSRSVVTGIEIGPLRIALLQAVDEVDVPAQGAVRDHPHVTVSGVTVAGQPAVVDDSGVHLVGTSAGSPVPALAQQGLDVRLLGASRQDRPGAVRSAAGGLLVSVSVPVTRAPQLVPGLPSVNRRYVGSVLVGGAGAVVAAGVGSGIDLGLPPPAVPGSPAAHVTPPYVAPPTSVPGLPQAGSGSFGPKVAGATDRVRGVLLYPFASVRAVALLLLFLPLLMLGLWRAHVARTWRS
jgi:hypothetical protein